jgi:hypothetical protein
MAPPKQKPIEATHRINFGSGSERIQASGRAGAGACGSRRHIKSTGLVARGWRLVGEAGIRCIRS